MSNLIGFSNQTSVLFSAYETSNLHSSIIFYGPKGIGKFLFIKNYLNEILKLNFKSNNYLHHSNLFNNNTHPNIKIINKLIDQKTKKIKSSITIEQIRSLKKFLNESSNINDFPKFIIIDSADDLNINSSNSLLKNLEEPKKNTYFFLISHQLSNLLPTIRSRCLKIKFNKHNYKNFYVIIKKELEKISDREIKFFYDLTNGSPGMAISLYDDNVINFFDITINSLLNKTIDNNYIELTNRLSKLENEKFKIYLSVLKTLLISLNKLKISNYDSEIFLSDKFKLLSNLSKILSKQNIVDRFYFLTNNENDLFSYNLDKKLFMLKFLNI